MTAEQLRNSILQEAISGRLVPQDPNDEPASVLLTNISICRDKLVKEKKVKAKDITSDPITEDEIPFKLPAKWEFVRLNYVAIIARGGSPRPIKEYLTDSPEGLNWIKIGDTEKGGKYINQTKERIKPEGLKKSRLIHKGDFLLTNSMSFGRPYISNIEGCIHDGWLVISPAFGNAFDKDFLYYLLSSPFAKDQFAGKVSGAVVQNLNSEKVATSILPLPPLAEQQRIAAKLEELLPIVEQYGKAQKELDELNAALPARLRQSILQEAISGRLVPQDPNEDAEDVKTIEIEDAPFEIPNNWRWCSLGDLVDMVSGTSYKKDDVRTKGVRILRGGNIVNDELVLAEDDVFLPDEYANLEKNIRKDDIIIVASTGSQKVIGKPALIRQNYDKTQIGAFLRIIRAKDVKYVPFLWLIFKGMYYREHIRNLVKGTNINNIKEEYITTLPIPLPPLAEQQRIVAKIEELFEQINRLSEAK